MARTGKTEEVKIIQLNYGYGWEDESTYAKSEYKNIRGDFKEYLTHAKHYGARVRLITRRINKEDY